MRICVLLIVLTGVVSRGAETNEITQKYQETANQIIDTALRDEAGYAKLTYLCDRIGNRLSGSESLLKAISWAAEQMKKDGLQNVVMPPVKVPHWVRGNESGAILSPINRPLHMLGLGMSVGTPPSGITADALVVSNFDELTQAGDRASGKIVVFNAPYEGYGKTVAYRVAGASRAAKLGAVAVLVRSITPLALQQPHTGTMIYAKDSPQIPAAAISIEDATLLSRLQASGETPRVHLEMSAHTESDAEAANVIGEIPGSEHPEEVVVMGGHIDSWDVGQGAQDDGSGIMATLEAAALLHRLGLKPKRTIRVVFWVNEENGGRGGEAYLQWIGDKIKNHVAAIEMDEGAERPLGFGYGPFRGFRRPIPGLAVPPPKPLSAAEGASMQVCQQIGQLLSRIQANQVNAGGGGSDIEPLVTKGVPSLSPTTTGEHYFDWHHTQADTLDKVNPEDFRKNVAVLAVLAYVLADMPGRLAGTAGASE
ncbi:MAG: M20/M25/M40 family metallo-hydrolase [Acidobacteriaceae bacterium]|nr:M20/M25/M40 family metallo-hydrolase [Acidobacteriaceae bacterium]